MQGEAEVDNGLPKHARPFEFLVCIYSAINLLSMLRTLSEKCARDDDGRRESQANGESALQWHASLNASMTLMH
jgi:hypothetical protein